MAEESKELASGHPLVQAEVAGEVAQAAADGNALTSGVEPEDAEPTTGGRIRPRSNRIVVVLPAPFGPRNPKTARSTVKPTSTILCSP
jgi:hypothetical protein